MTYPDLDQAAYESACTESDARPDASDAEGLDRLPRVDRAESARLTAELVRLQSNVNRMLANLDEVMK